MGPQRLALGLYIQEGLNMARRCWQDELRHIEEMAGYASDEYIQALDRSRTCMLPCGHEGSHEWTDDDDILVTFADEN